MDQALKIAFSVQETEKQEKFNESFYTRFDKSVKLQSHSPSRTRHEDWKPLSWRDGCGQSHAWSALQDTA